jgi:hypothetical protein
MRSGRSLTIVTAPSTVPYTVGDSTLPIARPALEKAA